MKGIISSRATSFRLPFPTVRKTVPWTSNLRTTCLLNGSPPSPSLKRLFFRYQNRRREQGLRCNLGGGLVVVRCGVTEINESQFQETVLKSDVPVLVEFVAGWCGPCRLISPVIDWVSEEYKDKLKVVKIDHDASPQLIEQYKVYGLPTLILFKNGQEVPESRKEGAITKVKLKEYLDALLESASVI